MKQPDPRFEPIHKQFCPVVVQKIREVEAKLRARLPTAYVEFLLQYGGCGFAGDANVYFDKGSLPIFTFFDDQKLLSRLDFYEDLTAECKMAIADDMAGNTFVLDASAGSVHFLDYSINPPVGTAVAKTFDSFLEAIRVKPP